ncbi:MAG: 2-C-methyl-D-erythritol 4-phosphate cytidylyltransferase [Myxococcota bacterium]
MSLGAIILIPAGKGDAALAPLLGAPVALRALGAVLVPREDVHAVAVAPPAIHEALKREADRFGLGELEKILAPKADERQSVLAALAELPDGVDVVVVHHGLTALCPTARVVELVASARESGAAMCALPIRTPVFSSKDELESPLQGPLCTVHWPAAFQREVLTVMLRTATEPELLSCLGAAGRTLRKVAGDRDAFPVEDEADLTRALEAWGRRATEYTFLWPRPGEAGEGSLGQPGPEVTTEGFFNTPMDVTNVTIPDTPVDEES